MTDRDDICDDVLARLLLGATLDEAAAAHVRACARCAAQAPIVRGVARALEADVVPAPPASLSARTLTAAKPVLARHRRPEWRPHARAIAAALLPLPLVVTLDAYVARTAYRLLCAVLPSALSTYIVTSWTVTAALLLAATYAAVPLLAERQLRVQGEESHA
jgi:hypothetical protein